MDESEDFFPGVLRLETDVCLSTASHGDFAIILCRLNPLMFLLISGVKFLREVQITCHMIFPVQAANISVQKCPVNSHILLTFLTHPKVILNNFFKMNSTCFDRQNAAAFLFLLVSGFVCNSSALTNKCDHILANHDVIGLMQKKHMM